MLTLGFATKINEPVKAYAYSKLINTNVMTMTKEQETKFFDKVGNTITSTIQALGLSRLHVKAQTLTDKDGNVVTLEKEAGEPAVGDVASPDGTFTMENGTVITVADGKVSEVTPATAETELEKANAEVARLTQELADATAAKETAEAAQAAADAKAAEMETAKAGYEAKKVEAAALVAELEGLRNEWKPAARDSAAANAAAAAKAKAAAEKGEFDVDRVQEIIKLKNSK